MTAAGKRIVFVIILGLIAVLTSAGILWLTTVYPDLNADKPFESDTYAMQLGAAQYEHVQERRDGKNTTTLNFTVNSDRFNAETFFNRIGADVESLNDSELINLVVKIREEDKTLYTLSYYPTSPESYSSGRWRAAVSLFESEVTSVPAGYTLTVTEKNQDTKVDVALTQTKTNFDNLSNDWENLLQGVVKTYPMNPEYRNIYSVQYKNVKVDEGDVEFAANATFASQVGLDYALSRNLKTVQGVVEQDYSYLKFKNLVWTINPEELPYQEQIVFVVEDKGDGLQDALKKFRSETAETKPRSPSTAEYVFRYELDGKNLAVYPSLYMKQ